MQQVIQNFRSGELGVGEVPIPALGRDGLLVANVRSLISAGTERATVDVAQKSLLGKAAARPDLVRKVLDKVRRDGVADTMKMVFQRLDSPVALGYSCAGTVIAVGENVRGFTVGDRVACAGQNYASHAEYVFVPRNLCVRIPDGVDFDSAAYVTLGAIALQGVRQAEPRLGEVVAVIGLGLLGQLTVQLLRANGCQVIASDIAPQKLAMARSFGAIEAVLPGDLHKAVLAATGGQGVDSVLITASTKENDPIEVAGEICRRKGRVVVVGAVGMNLPREPYYQKELELRLSMSYGPGRYDPAYEEKGRDYPYGYVRWTENRNMEAFLRLVRDGKVDLAPLTSHSYPIGDAADAYQMMMAGTNPYLGILITYPEANAARSVAAIQIDQSRSQERIALGIIGGGNHVRDMLLPHLAGQPDLEIRWVCTATGVSANSLGQRLKVPQRTTDYRDVLNDPGTNSVLIGSRHGTHARFVCEALAAGKHVFVEKPLCLTEEELREISAAYAARAADGIRLMVGFNRRYSEHGRRAREFFAGHRDPLVMVYRVNAGAIPADHWVQDPDDGGGRIIGEACHFLDYMQFVCGARPVRARGLAIGTHASGITEDNSILSFKFEDGSIGTIIYAAGGDKSLAKERFEAFGDGKSLTMNDFLVSEFYDKGRCERFKTPKRDKGFATEMRQFCDEVIRGGPPSMSFADIEAVSLACMLAARSLRTGDEFSLR